MDAGEALTALVALQAIPGALAAVLGISIARGASHVHPVPVQVSTPDREDARFLPAGSTHYSLTALSMHIVLMLTGLGLLPFLPSLLTPVPVAAYLVGVLLRYPGLRPRFARSRLWFEFGAVAILAGVLLGVLAPGGKGTWWTGLQSGIAMTARATLVVTAFSAISLELRNPVVLNWFLQRGLGNVSSALTVAFRVLPVMIQSLNQQRNSIRHPLRALSQMLATMLSQLQDDAPAGARPRVYILTGNQGEGKTTLLRRVVARLRNDGVAVGGILAHVCYDGDARAGYDIEDVRTGERAVLCRTDDGTASHTVGPFVFHQEGLSLGARALAGGAEHPGALVIVDEVGPLELQGGGWASAVQQLLKSDTTALLLVIRPALVKKLQHEWRFHAERVWDVSQTREEEIAGVLCNDCPFLRV